MSVPADDFDFDITGDCSGLKVAVSFLSPHFPAVIFAIGSLPQHAYLLTTAPDANDESLQRYKESLGLGGGKDLSDPNDPRTCIIKSLSLESPGRPPITIDLSEPGSESTLKDKPFTIKEGAKFTMVVTFKVQHEIISGLSYVQVVKRKGIRVSKDSEMLGSYGPNTDKQPIYTKRCELRLPPVCAVRAALGRVQC